MPDTSSIFMLDRPASWENAGEIGLEVRYGAETTGFLSRGDGFMLDLAVPSLGRVSRERFACQGGKVREKRGLHLIDDGDTVTGFLAVAAVFPLAEVAFDAYTRLLEETAGIHLYRIWNYVPFINRQYEGMENYRSFCQGRASAFDRYFSRESAIGRMPAASAVGIEDTILVLYFVGGREPCRYVENPEQVPAYLYPRQYGPASPSFSRGCLTNHQGRKVAYVSGTSSIKNHESVGEGDVDRQLATTLENLDLVLREMDLTGALDPEVPCRKRLKVYLRDPEVYPKVRAVMEARLGKAARDIVYLAAAICRKELEIEIETTIEE